MNANIENAVEAKTEDTSHLCPPCPSVKGKRPKTGRPLSRMECLSERQLDHINAWLDEGVTLKEVVDLCKTEFQVEIPKTTFQRYYKRSAARTLIADLADSKEAAAEISKYAVTGIALFSVTTLEILEQQAFDLAVAFNRDADAEDLGVLKNLWTLIHKAKGTQIRERHAAVQEQKIQLRREELALKRELLASKNCGGTRSPSPTSPSRDAITNHDAALADQCASASLSQQGTPIREANVSSGETNSGRALPRSGSSLPLFRLREAIGLGEGFSIDP